jgi:hypothetical protein
LRELDDTSPVDDTINNLFAFNPQLQVMPHARGPWRVQTLAC